MVMLGPARREISTRSMTIPNREPAAAPMTTSDHTLTSKLRDGLRLGAEVLREAVCDYVDAARQRGDPVERIIIDLKQELRAAGAIDRYAHPKERELAESVIRWCIQRYYGSTRAD
mgnify:CR=1 FL=1